VALSPDGALSVRRSATGPPDAADDIGRRLAAEMVEDGAGSLLVDTSPVT
jgi:hydroxymethylbilane synthase